jgi:hypothetical protein
MKKIRTPKVMATARRASTRVPIDRMSLIIGQRVIRGNEKAGLAIQPDRLESCLSADA